MNTTTLKMQGKKFIILPLKNGEILAGLILNPRFVLFEKSAHVLYPKKPELFIRVLFDFLI